MRVPTLRPHRRGWQQFDVVLRDPDLRRLLIASTVSTTARWTYMVALLVVAYDQAGAVGLAILGLARTVPTAVAVPLVGVIGARMPARRLLVLTYAARALTIGVAALAVPLHFTPVVLAMAGLDAVLGTLRRPVQAALLPFVTQSAGDLVAANVATSTGDGLAAFLGPLVGGAALVIAGPAPVLLLAALEFVVSAAFAAMIRASGETVGAATGSTLLALRDGAAAIAGHGIPRLVGVGFLVELLVTGALGVLLVPAATDLLHTGPAGVGTLYAAMGLGGLVGAAVAVIAIGPGRLVGTFLAALAGWGVPLVVLGSVGSAPIAAAMLAVCGAAAASLDVAGYSLLQRALPTRVRQQALALFEGVAQGALGLGGVLAPALIAWLGVAGAFVASGTALLAISIVLAPALLGHRAALARRTADVEQLRSLPLFEPLSLAVVEQLAAGAARLVFEPGATLIREGDVGDRFYVIVAGTVEVTREGQHLSDVAAVGGVGEIALLHRVPRTATVVARDGVRALSIDGPDFLAAVTCHPRSLEVALTLSSVRSEEQTRRAAAEPEAN